MASMNFSRANRTCSKNEGQGSEESAFSDILSEKFSSLLSAE